MPLHVLVNNAGVFLPPFAKTAEGFEVTIGINYIGKAADEHEVYFSFDEIAPLLFYGISWQPWAPVQSSS